MHIPDGYLSPMTCAAAFAAAAPLWYMASRRAEREVGVGELPLVALGAAFVFVIMMLNVPVPGGTAGHMTGAVVLAIVIGPWAAAISVSLVLAIQALLFGDGGITTFGANCLNMAFIMSFAGYGVYRLGTMGNAGRARRALSAAVAGYVGVNLAALATAIELGIQPALASNAAGLPLYSPYPLSVTVPAMMASHLLFFATGEAVGTSLVTAYLERMGIARRATGGGAGAGGANLRPAYMAVAALVVVTPAGLLAAGTPWGEWSTGEISSMVGFVPEGLARMSEAFGAWRGLLPGYALAGADGPVARAAVYIISAVAGSIGVVAGVYAWGRAHRRA